VITAVLAGSTAGVIAPAAAAHSLAAALIPGAAVALVTLVGLMRFQRSAWKPGLATTPIEQADDGP
jgi:hypothetical protein